MVPGPSGAGHNAGAVPALSSGHSREESAHQTLQKGNEAQRLSDLLRVAQGIGGRAQNGAGISRV